jgi:hypothetical protein
LSVDGAFARLAWVTQFRSTIYAFGRVISHGQVDALVWPGRIVKRGHR